LFHICVMGHHVEQHYDHGCTVHVHVSDNATPQPPLGSLGKPLDSIFRCQ
jgi:hypothetical protein